MDLFANMVIGNRACMICKDSIDIGLPYCVECADKHAYTGCTFPHCRNIVVDPEQKRLSCHAHTCDRENCENMCKVWYDSPRGAGAFFTCEDHMRKKERGEEWKESNRCVV